MIKSRVEGWKTTFPSVLISKPIRAFPVGLYDRAPIQKWYEGRVVLCGDASHATTPLGGQVSFFSPLFHDGSSVNSKRLHRVLK
jgi:hypothetical protein